MAPTKYFLGARDFIEDGARIRISLDCANMKAVNSSRVKLPRAIETMCGSRSFVQGDLSGVKCGKESSWRS